MSYLQTYLPSSIADKIFGKTSYNISDPIVIASAVAGLTVIGGTTLYIMRGKSEKRNQQSMDYANTLARY